MLADRITLEVFNVLHTIRNVFILTLEATISKRLLHIKVKYPTTPLTTLTSFSYRTRMSFIGSKKGRVIGVSLTIIALFTLFLMSRHILTGQDFTEALSGASLIQSSNDAASDDAINKQISAEKNGQVPVNDMGKGDVNDSGHFDPAKALIEIMSMGPMIVFSKSYCPFSKNLKKLLSENYDITPAPTIVELDKHRYGAELQNYLSIVTKRNTVPNVIVGADSLVSRGGAQEFINYHEEGTLAGLLNTWGGKDISVSRIEVPLNH